MSIHLVLRLNQNLESLIKHNPAFQELFWAEIESCFVCLHLREPHLEPGSACSFGELYLSLNTSYKETIM